MRTYTHIWLPLAVLAFYKWESLDTMFNNHLMKACLAAVFAIGLAACSSSSDQTAAPDPMPTEPAPPTQAEQDLEELKNEIAALRTQLGIDDTADIGDTVAELQATLKGLQDEAAKKAREAAAKDAVALFDGITETTTQLTVVIGTAGNNGVSDEDGVGGMASVTATGLTPGVGGDDVTKSAEPMLGDWQGTMLSDAVPAIPATATNAGTSSTVVVYTDITGPDPVDFGDVHTLDANGNLALVAGADTDAHVGLISASAFTHTGRVVHDPDADVNEEVIRIRGMFNGAAGEFRCTEASGTTGDCVSIESSAGVRLAGTWVFDPDSGAMAMMADPSFAYFGWWLNKGTTEGVEAGVFHGVTDGTGDDELLGAATAATFTPLGSTATYSGSAAGKYALKPSLSAASGGHWTADATLTADFGNETTNGMISGMIENFMSGDEMMDWSVKLGETALTETGTFNSATGDPATGDGVVWTIGGADGAESGAWSGGLRGQGDNSVPTVATGMFSATHQAGTETVVGQIIGAFGAHLDE